MKDRTKNIFILTILTIFLLMIKLIPVTCFFKQVTGISCPACGMTRAFYCILRLDLIHAFCYNILSIPLFLLIIVSYFNISYDIIINRFTYIPKLLKTLSNKWVAISIMFLLLLSFILNNS